MLQLNHMNSAAMAGCLLVTLAGAGCATKKYVRQQVDPVTGRVQTVEQTTAKNTSSINELENNVSQVNEKAMGADRKAGEAHQAADQANQLAVTAKNRADEVGANADRRFSDVDQSIRNIDNFQQVSTESVLFAFDKSTLSKDAQAKLDQLVSGLSDQNRYVIEIEGYTDRTGGSAYNLNLSAKRADAVVRYLTLKHQVPLRRIHVLGAGEVERDQQASGREGRKQARRVDVKVYGPATTASGSNTPTSSSAIPSTNAADQVASK